SFSIASKAIPGQGSSFPLLGRSAPSDLFLVPERKVASGSASSQRISARDEASAPCSQANHPQHLFSMYRVEKEYTRIKLTFLLAHCRSAHGHRAAQPHERDGGGEKGNRVRRLDEGRRRARSREGHENHRGQPGGQGAPGSPGGVRIEELSEVASRQP